MWRLGAVLALAAGLAGAQAPARITQPVNLRQTVRLQGNTVWRRHAAVDRGAAPPDLPLNHMLLLLRRSPQQQAALEQLLAAQQEAGSPQFHRWLTPRQFGERFGPSPQDIATVEQWLQDQGFQIESVAPGALTIAFSGTAAQVAESLHTQIHRYQASQRGFWANAGDPSIPRALAPVVAGVVSLNNFPSHPMIHLLAQGRSYRPVAGEPTPQLNFEYNGILERAMVPGDFTTIYNVKPLAAEGLNGTGQTIAIVARSDIAASDLVQYRSLFQPGAPMNVLTTIHATAADPGQTDDENEDEATLDTEWAGAADPDAQLDLVVASSTATTDGVDLAAQYAVDHNLAPVLTASFGECEAALGATENQFFNSLWQQAAAEGITVLVSAGDNGPAGCDPPSATSASGGLAVSGLASTPYDTAVGGTQFAEGGGSYWSDNAASDYSSALSYIPEHPWNEVNEAINGGGIWSGSGGASIIYSAPYWQIASGIPLTNAHRLLPDVALSAALHDGYVVCEHASCQQGSGGSFTFYVFSGTSAASPALAGVLALVDQSQKARQGLANPKFYALASRQTLASCDSSNNPAPSCTIYDVTQGNNFVPCAAGSLGCLNGSMGFAAAPGYDEATGLGSINAANLVANWASAGVTMSQTALSVTPPANATFGQQIPLSIQVTGSSSNGAAPSGKVELVAVLTGGTEQVVQVLTLAGGDLSTTTNQLPGGSYNLVARYDGDQNYSPSISAPVAVSLAPAAATVSLVLYTSSPSQPVSTVVYGPLLHAEVHVTGPAGAPVPSGDASVVPAPSSTGANYAVGVLQLDSTGTVHFNAVLEANPGTYALQARYSGSSSLLPANSAPVPITVIPSPTSITITQSAPGYLNVIVNSESEGFTPNQYNVYDGSTLVGAGGGGVEVNLATGTMELQSTYEIPPLPGTSAVITAQVPASPGYLPSTSNTLNITTPPNLIFSPASLSFGSVAFGQSSSPQTATLTNEGGTAIAPNLNLNPFNGDYSQTSTCPASLPSLASCTVSVVFQPTEAGVQFGNGVAALFAGNTFRLELTGAGVGFYLSTPADVPTVSSGQSGTYTIAAIPVGGFTGPVTFSCSQMPPDTTCSFSPPSVTLDGSHSATTTMTVTTGVTAASSQGGAGWPTVPFDGELLLLATAVGLLLFEAPRRRVRRASLLLAGVSLAMLLAIACGGAGSSVPPPPPPPPSGSGGSGSGNGPSQSPPITLSSTSANLGFAAIGHPSPPVTVTISNSSALQVALQGLAITTGDSADFKQTNNCPATLAAGSLCSVTLTFTPSSAGTESSALQIAYSGAGSPQSLALTGTGVNGTPPGQYTLTISATSPGQPVETALVVLNVN